MLGKWTKWASLGKAAETPPRAAEASTRSQDQRDPTEKVTERAVPLPTSASTSPELKLKLAALRPADLAQAGLRDVQPLGGFRDALLFGKGVQIV